MAIVSVSMLSARLPGSPSGTDLTLAVNRASSFVNTWANRYDPFDDYQESPESILAPAEIGELCLISAEAFYYKQIGQRSRNGEEAQRWHEFLYGKDGIKKQLVDIRIEPEWKTQTISLTSDKTMVIGSRTTTGGMWPRVIPFTAQVISATNNVWIYPDDWYIRQGGLYDDEYCDAWYFDCDSGSSVEGTLRYMRTYRNDNIDYARYTRG